MITRNKASGRSESHNLYNEKLAFIFIQIIILFPVFVKSNDFLLKSGDPISRKLLFTLANNLAIDNYSFFYYLIYTISSTAIIFLLKNKLQMLIFGALYLSIVLTTSYLESTVGLWLLLLISPLLLMVKGELKYSMVILSFFFVSANSYLFYQPPYNNLIPSLKYLQTNNIICDATSILEGPLLEYLKPTPSGTHRCSIEDLSFNEPGLYLPLPGKGVLFAQENN